IPTPFGTFHATNLTSDPEHGLGAWSDDEIDRAIRRGELRDGSVESPVMPYYRYAGMSDRDARDLVAWLRTLPASATPNRPAEGELPLPRLAYRAWRLLFAGRVTAPAEAPEAGVERGAYLARHVSICGDCHTPRDRFGVSIPSLELAGVPGGGPLPWAPNVTPDRETGVGDWDVSDLENLLATGFTPEYDNVQGAMAEVVDGKAGAPGYGRAPASDRAAIAAWMKTIPPIHRVVREDGADPADANAPAATKEKPA
ncbi:MAG: c-type cytochrome, partial [Alphaproteobacteria bacterium]